MTKEQVDHLKACMRRFDEEYLPSLRQLPSLGVVPGVLATCAEINDLLKSDEHVAAAKHDDGKVPFKAAAALPHAPPPPATPAKVTAHVSWSNDEDTADHPKVK